jgi:uncharacterized protein YdaU (DUF1376 family)
MPVERIIDHPELLTMGAAPYGILMRLVHHFWNTECRPLPKDNDHLASIACAHRPTWVRLKPQILKIFDDIRPHLEAYYDLRVRRGTHLSRLANKRAGIMKLRAIDTAARLRKGVERERVTPKTLNRVKPQREDRPGRTWRTD